MVTTPPLHKSGTLMVPAWKVNSEVASPEGYATLLVTVYTKSDIVNFNEFVAPLEQLTRRVTAKLLSTIATEAEALLSAR